jgi:hypothetical protein
MKETVLEKYAVGESVKLGSCCGNDLEGWKMVWEKCSVVKDNKVTVVLKQENGHVYRFDKRNERMFVLERA